MKVISTKIIDNRYTFKIYLNAKIEEDKDFINKYFYLMNNENTYLLVLREDDTYTEKYIQTYFLESILDKNPPFNLSNLSFLYSSASIENTSGYIAKTTTPYQWKQSDSYCVYKYYEDKNISIIRIKGLLQTCDLIPYFSSTQYIFVSVPWIMYKHDYEKMLDLLFTFNKSNRANIFIECSDLDAILWAHEYGFKYLFCNNNAWIDYNLFRDLKDLKDLRIEKKYDMIMNCRSQNVKRPYFAKHIDNLAFIKNKPCVFNTDFDHTTLKYTYTNDRVLTHEEIALLCNESHCGGIFSQEEGCCYASSEYILCGIPVISTPSRGGRDVWYTKDNSIIVENELEVKSAVELLKNKNIDSKVIIEHHVNLSNTMRQNFNNVVQSIFISHNIQINASKYFSKTYFHLFQTWHQSIHDAILIFKSPHVQLSNSVILDVFNTLDQKRSGRKLLVFGLGYDSILWHNYTNTYFVENDKKYIKMFNTMNVIKYKYPTTVKDSFTIKDPSKFSLPKDLQKLAPFDVILIDAPCGYDDTQCGRLLPIYWSKKYLSKKDTVIYIDDSNRKLESYLIDKYFKKYNKTYFPQRDGTIKLIHRV